MAASFIKKNDGNYYMRLTDNTTQVKFAAVSQAGNTYTFSINGSVVVSKIYNDDIYDPINNPSHGTENIYYTASANPIPAGSPILSPYSVPDYNNCLNGYYDSANDTFICYQYGTQLVNRFPGSETAYTYSRTTGPNTQTDYSLTFSSSGTGTTFYLGGTSLNWGSNLYAYPGSGYISNPLAVGVKDSGSWKNSYNMFIKNSNQWKEVKTAWIKQGGVWKKFFQNYGNSSWINMLEGTDDAIDFAVQVIALN